MAAEADLASQSIIRARNKVAVSIELREMTEEELAGFIATAQPRYQRQLSEFGGLPLAEAQRKANAEFSQLFPSGRPAAGMHLFVAKVSGTPVGHLWLAEQTPGGSEGVAFVYEIEVHEDKRCRGYGTAIMQAAERSARSLGATALDLNVFGGNHGARHLYERLDYHVTWLRMRKPLKP
jgi:ribosomal protein S18 acetylase RimI-like enzyme